MPAPDPATAQPTISVIVPARDEEASLGACLESLVAQTGVSFEIIVVDDGSTDRTREIAQSFSGVCVVDAGPLPRGWTGKNNAMATGAKHARGVKSSGRRIFFRYGGDVVRTRMYRDSAQLREGWTKNPALLFPSPRRLALLRLLEFILILATAGLAFIEGIRGRANAALVMIAAAIVLYALFLVRIRKAHFPWRANAAALLGLPLFAYLLQRSELCYKQGAVSWKGRAYSTRLAERKPSQCTGNAAAPRANERAIQNNLEVAALTSELPHEKHSGA